MVNEHRLADRVTRLETVAGTVPGCPKCAPGEPFTIEIVWAGEVPDRWCARCGADEVRRVRWPE